MACGRDAAVVEAAGRLTSAKRKGWGPQALKRKKKPAGRRARRAFPFAVIGVPACTALAE